MKYECKCNCGCEQGYDYQPSTICSECQDEQHQGTMTQRYYQIYWCSEDGQRAYHLDPETNCPYRYYTYADMFEEGERIRSFSGEHKLMFDVIEVA